MSGVPLRYLLPWPDGWLGPAPQSDLLDRLLVGRIDASGTAFGIAFSCDVYIVGGVSFPVIPGFVGVMLGGDDDAIGVSLVLGDADDGAAFRFAMSGVDVSLAVDASILRPLLAGTDDPDLAATQTLVPFGDIGFAIDAAGGFRFDAAAAIALPRCMLGTTGVIVEADAIVPRLSSEQALPAAAAALGLADDWRGVFIGLARVSLPDGLADILPDDLTLERCAIGDNGFSGQLSADWTPPFAATLFGIELALAHAGIELRDNELVGVDVRGTLTFPALTDANGAPAAIGFVVESGPAGYRLAAANVPPLKIGGVVLDVGDIAIGFDATTLTSVDLAGTLTLPGLTDDAGAPAAIAFDVGYAAGLFALQVQAFPTLHLGPLGVRIDSVDLTFDQTGPRSTAVAATLTIPGLEAETGGPAQIGVQIGVGADRFTAAVTALPPLKLGSIVLQLDTLALAFGGAAPFAAAIAGHLTIPGATDDAGQPISIGFDLAVQSDRFRITSTGLPAFRLAGVEVRLTTLSIGFNAGGVIAADTAIAGTVRLPAFKDGAGNPLEIAVAIDLSDGFAVTAIVPGGGLEVLSIGVIRIVLHKLGVGVNAAGPRFSIGGQIDLALDVPLVGDLLPSTIAIDDLSFAAPNDFNLALALTWRSGLRAGSDGHGGFELDVPVGEIGAGLSLDAIGLRLRDTGAGYDLAVLFRGATLALGPAVGVVDGLGFAATFTPAPAGGNLGPLEVGLRFVPPKGIGVSLDTSTVRLGGFLLIDPDAGRYVGAVEIAILDTFELTAIAIITTKLPDGSEGFALLFLISMTLPVPIPLGYNFYFAGAGGLLGLNRGVDLDHLREGIRTGSADNVLFPKDVVRRINQIVLDLEQSFPQAPGQFLVGPMALITWSQPPLVSVKLGLIIEIGRPVRIAILGVLRAALPTPDQAILDLKVAFLGAIDFEASLLSFDASIYDSYIGYGSFKLYLEGDIALRICWGRQPDFVTSVGGFHPSFSPPSHLHLPKMRRLSLSLLKDNPRITLSVYFAITSNTVQCGARLDFVFKAGPFSVVGDFGFDVLFQFSPFHIDAHVWAGLAVRFEGADILAIQLDFNLLGPNPWIARGTASFKVLFFSVSVDFEARFGQESHDTLPDVEVLPQLVTELARDASWRGELAAGVTSLVIVRPPPAGALVIDAAGRLTVSQRLLPFDTDFSLFGTSRPVDAQRVRVKQLLIGGDDEPTIPVFEDFAPAAFREMKDKDKLAAPAYELRRSGVQMIAGSTLATDAVVARPVAYEVILSDVAAGGTPTRGPRTADTDGATFERLIAGGAAGRSPAARAHARRAEAGKVLDLGASRERYAVVSRELRPLDDQGQPAAPTGVDPAGRAVYADAVLLTLTDAEQRRSSLIARGLGAGALEVIPEAQLAA